MNRIDKNAPGMDAERPKKIFKRSSNVGTTPILKKATAKLKRNTGGTDRGMSGKINFKRNTKK